MLSFTLITRQMDGLALAADTETGAVPDVERLKVAGKNILRKLTSQQGTVPPRLTVAANTGAYHILTDGGVQFLVMTEDGGRDAQALAYAYLDDIAKEFLAQYGAQVDGARRPYTFIKYDMYLQKTKRTFTSGRSAQLTQRAGNMDVVKRSFRDVMGYGDAPGGKASKSGGNGQLSEGATMAIVGGVVAGSVLLVLLVIWAVTRD